MEKTRKFEELRVSITSKCNLACKYCVGPNGNLLSPAGFNADVESLLDSIARLHKKLNFHTLHITGGEPTLYPELERLLAGITDIHNGLPFGRIAMTSNGTLIDKVLPVLESSALDSLNFSLDAVSPDVYEDLSRRKFKPDIQGQIAKIAAGKLQVKINCTVMNGINSGEILSLVEFGRKHEIPVRFLELMRMGPLYNKESFDRYFFSQQQILDTISERYAIKAAGRKASATAGYFELPDGYRFGIIANESQPFCIDCDRLRISSDGLLYGCLSSNHGIEMPASDSELDGVLVQAMSQKQDVKFTGSELHMQAIGG